ncbi:mannosyl (alpha-1,3-)-glycoprotein beta-1,4-N-acetylglucosaminyltransferase, isozyme A [Ictidomys tridecemlineatus]|nr:mannosyl (alpha-1,3-)-glycoprotein beta-1,4-N-acetylglucosaminyltransferase, isozyme A [Ictidomys tridecemlineatus]
MKLLDEEGDRDCEDAEKLIAYQREFLALKERLRIAEHRISQRSSELNNIVQQFRSVGVETNGSKDALNKFSGNTLKLLKELTSKKSLQVPTIYYHLPHLLQNEGSLQPAVQIGNGRTGVSIVMGIPTVKREVKSYLIETLHSLIDNLYPEEKLDCVIVVFIGETDVDYVHSVVANLEKEKKKTRSIEVHEKSNTKTNITQLEDDIIVKQNYFNTIKNFALQLSSEEWMILEFSQLGFIGKMFQAPDLTLIVEFIFMFYKEKPIDWLLDHILWVKVCNPEKDAKHCDRQKANLRIRFRPSLFQHVGLHSSLSGKIQKLTDKDYMKPLLLKIHVNPPAEVSTSLKVYQGHTLEKTYMGEDFFWAITPIAGDYILFKFDKPVNVESYLFHSGNQEHPGDILLNTTVEVLPLKREGLEISKETKDKRLEDGYFRIGKFENGVAEGMVDPSLNPISAFRLSVIQNSAVWAILNEIHIKKITN